MEREEKSIGEIESIVMDESFFEKFKEKRIYLAIKVLKKETTEILSLMKGKLLKFKGIPPVLNKQDTDYNYIIINIISNEKEKEILTGELKTILEDAKLNISSLEVQDIPVELKYENFNYDHCIRKILPPCSKDIPSSYELIGKIAHMNLREEYLPYKKIIGRMLLDKNPAVKTVVNKLSKIDNVYRTYEMELLAGDDNYMTNHNEGNCTFQFDIRKVYWCSKLATERDRILKKFLKKGEVLVDAFCGVGPLSIRAAKNGVRVYANDLNPDCYMCLKKNIQLNKIKKDIHAYNMDAREFIRGMFDNSEKFLKEDNNFDKVFPENLKINHIYMNLPKDAIEFLDVYSGIISSNNNVYTSENLPIIHVYGFSNSPNAQSELLDRCAEAMKIDKFPLENLIDFTNIRDISPKKYMFSISFKLPEIVAFKK